VIADVNVTVVVVPSGTEEGLAAVVPITGGEIVTVAFPDFV
jgi:hypothetical protein